MTYDEWDVLGLIFCGLLLGGIALFWLVVWIDRHNPFTHTHRNVAGRSRMATDWRKPQYLPEDWR